MNSTYFIDHKGERIKLRLPQKSDTAALLDFFDSLSKKSKNLFQPHPFDEKSAYKIANNKGLIVLATIGNNQLEKIVGYTFIHKIPVTGGGNFGIAVEDLYASRGIGKKLTEEILTLAKAKGFKKIYLTVKTKNKNAIALYQKVGFGSFGNNKQSLSFAKAQDKQSLFSRRLKNKLIKSWIQIYELISNFGWLFFAQTAINVIFGKKGRQDESLWMVKDFI